MNEIVEFLNSNCISIFGMLITFLCISIFRFEVYSRFEDSEEIIRKVCYGHSNIQDWLKIIKVKTDIENVKKSLMKPFKEYCKILFEQLMMFSKNENANEFQKYLMHISVGTGDVSYDEKSITKHIFVFDLNEVNNAVEVVVDFEKFNYLLTESVNLFDEYLFQCRKEKAKYGSFILGNLRTCLLFFKKIPFSKKEIIKKSIRNVLNKK